MSKKTMENKQKKKHNKKITLLILVCLSFIIGAVIIFLHNNLGEPTIITNASGETLKVNIEIKKYYETLSGEGIFEEFLYAQEDIEYMTNPETMSVYAESGEGKAQIVDGIALECQAGAYYMAGLDGYVKYFKDFPNIINELEPKRADLAKLNGDLSKIFIEEIHIFEEFARLIHESEKADTTIQRKEEIYDELVALNFKNTVAYNRFLNWNNLLLANIYQKI